MTLSPQFLQELQEAEGEVVRKLDPAQSQKMDIKQIRLDEKAFRLMLNDNAMATEKLSEGIRHFARDAIKLQETIRTIFKLDW